MYDRAAWKERLRKAYSTLRPSEQRVADYLLNTAHPGDLTMKSLAQEANVSEPTVMRCMKALGYHGYKDFQHAVQGNRLEEAPAHTFDPLMGFDLRPWDSVANLPERTIQTEIHLLERTLCAVSPEALEQAATLLAGARLIDLYEVENSFAPGNDLLVKLTYLGLPCRMQTDAYLQQISAAHLTSQDVAVAISYTGCSADTVAALRLAHKAGAATIAISSRKDPILKRYADVFLLTGGEDCRIYGNAIFSRTQDLAVIDMLYMAVILSDYERFSQNLDRSGAVIAYRESTES